MSLVTSVFIYKLVTVPVVYLECDWICFAEKYWIEAEPAKNKINTAAIATAMRMLLLTSLILKPSLTLPSDSSITLAFNNVV